MRGLIGDLRYAVRILLKSPGPTAVALLALTLGIGANTACFSTIYALVQRPFAFPELDRLVRLWDHDTRSGAHALKISAGDFQDLRDSNRSFSGLAAVRPRGASLTGNGEPERLQASAVTAGFFPVLGLQPIVGRWILAEDDAPGAANVVVLSHGLWTRRFASDSRIAGTHHPTRRRDRNGRRRDAPGVRLPPRHRPVATDGLDRRPAPGSPPPDPSRWSAGSAPAFPWPRPRPI